MKEPILKFFKSGTNSSVTYSGIEDLYNIGAFIDEQMGRKPAIIKVRNKAYLAKFEFLGAIF